MHTIARYIRTHQNVIVAYIALAEIVCGVLYIQSVLNPGH